MFSRFKWRRPIIEPFLYHLLCFGTFSLVFDVLEYLGGVLWPITDPVLYSSALPLCCILPDCILYLILKNVWPEFQFVSR